MASKTERLSLRLTPEQDAVLRRAAEARGESANDFVLRHAVEAAEIELADRRVFVVDDAAVEPAAGAAVGSAGTPGSDGQVALESLGARATRLVAYVGPELLAGDHLLDGFDCGKPALNQWLIRHARKNQASGSSRTWVVVETDSREVVAFYASATASDTPIVDTKVHAAESTRRDARHPAGTDGGRFETQRSRSRSGTSEALHAQSLRGCPVGRGPGAPRSTPRMTRPRASTPTTDSSNPRSIHSS